MSNKVKDIDIKNRTCYFLMTLSIKRTLIRIILKYMKSHTKIFLFTIYVTIKDSKYVKINNVNPLYLISNKVNGYFQEINENEYSTLVPTNESKK